MLDRPTADNPRVTIIDQKWGCKWRFKIINIDCNFHSLRAIASATEEIKWLCLSEIKHVSTTPSNVRYEVFVNAIVVARLVHFQNIVELLVKPKILNWKKMSYRVREISMTIYEFRGEL